MASDLVSELKLAAMAYGRACKRVAALRRQLRAAEASKRLARKNLKAAEAAVRAECKLLLCTHCGFAFPKGGHCENTSCDFGKAEAKRQAKRS